jgi:hypothetical protein
MNFTELSSTCGVRGDIMRDSCAINVMRSNWAVVLKNNGSVNGQIKPIVRGKTTTAVLWAILSQIQPPTQPTGRPNA